MTTTLETERLLLREWRVDDFESFAAMMAEPEVMRLLAIDGKPFPRFAAWQGLCSTIGHWVLRGFGMFAVIEPSTGAFVGRVGPWEPEGWPDLEIGWTLRSAYWGKGYATEAASRCIAYAFTELRRSHVVSLILAENRRSIRVAERIGETLECSVQLSHMPPDKPLLQYGLSRHEWCDRRSSG
jgi:RimJ/RimL family protein N-acetyltransferase